MSPEACLTENLAIMPEAVGRLSSCSQVSLHNMHWLFGGCFVNEPSANAALQWHLQQDMGSQKRCTGASMQSCIRGVLGPFMIRLFGKVVSNADSGEFSSGSAGRRGRVL